MSDSGVLSIEYYQLLWNLCASIFFAATGRFFFTWCSYYFIAVFIMSDRALLLLRQQRVVNTAGVCYKEKVVSSVYIFLNRLTVNCCNVFFRDCAITQTLNCFYLVHVVFLYHVFHFAN